MLCQSFGPLLTVLITLSVWGNGLQSARGDEPLPRGFQMRTFHDADNQPHRYVIFVPYKTDPVRRPPVLLFLHGSGERGTNGIDQIMVGLGPALWKVKANFPFIADFPQCAPNSNWLAEGPDAQRALKILDLVEKEFDTDLDRVYLTGLSMGGAGAWSLAARDPQRFAAIVPMCGRGRVEDAELLARARLPIWNFCGDKDNPATVEFNRQMHTALTRAGAGDKYTEYENVGHNCWDNAYGTPELYAWLLEQSRSANAKAKAAQ